MSTWEVRNKIQFFCSAFFNVTHTCTSQNVIHGEIFPDKIIAEYLPGNHRMSRIRIWVDRIVRRMESRSHQLCTCFAALWEQAKTPVSQEKILLSVFSSYRAEQQQNKGVRSLIVREDSRNRDTTSPFFFNSSFFRFILLWASWTAQATNKRQTKKRKKCKSWPKPRTHPGWSMQVVRLVSIAWESQTLISNAHLTSFERRKMTLTTKESSDAVFWKLFEEDKHTMHSRFPARWSWHLQASFRRCTQLRCREITIVFAIQLSQSRICLANIRDCCELWTGSKCLFFSKRPSSVWKSFDIQDCRWKCPRIFSVNFLSQQFRRKKKLFELLFETHRPKIKIEGTAKMVKGSSLRAHFASRNGLKDSFETRISAEEPTNLFLSDG